MSIDETEKFKFRQKLDHVSSLFEVFLSKTIRLQKALQICGEEMISLCDKMKYSNAASGKTHRTTSAGCSVGNAPQYVANSPGSNESDNVLVSSNEWRPKSRHSSETSDSSSSDDTGRISKGGLTELKFDGRIEVYADIVFERRDNNSESSEVEDAVILEMEKSITDRGNASKFDSAKDIKLIFRNPETNHVFPDKDSNESTSRDSSKDLEKLDKHLDKLDKHLDIMIRHVEIGRSTQPSHYKQTVDFDVKGTRSNASLTKMPARNFYAKTFLEKSIREILERTVKSKCDAVKNDNVVTELMKITGREPSIEKTIRRILEKITSESAVVEHSLLAIEPGKITERGPSAENYVGDLFENAVGSESAPIETKTTESEQCGAGEVAMEASFAEADFHELHCELIDQLMADWHLQEQDVRAEMRNVRSVPCHRKRRDDPPLDSGRQAAWCCGYLHLYSLSHLLLAERHLGSLLHDEAPGALSTLLRSSAHLSVVSVGGGPGNDLVGFCSALYGRHRNIGSLDLTVVDLMPAWSRVFSRMISAVRRKDFGKASRLLREVQVKERFIEADLTDYNRLDSRTIRAINEADVIVVVKTLSIFPVQQQYKFIANVVLLMRPGTLLVCVDYPEMGRLLNAVPNCARVVHRSRTERHLSPAVPDRFGAAAVTKCWAQLLVAQKL